MRALVLAAALVTCAAAVRAEPQGATMQPAARARLERGLALYEARDYAAAIAEFRAGYAIDPRPTFLYNWAQAERLRGDCPGAMAIYVKYLALNPPRQEAEMARANLVRCEALLATRPLPVPVQPVASPGPAVPSSAPAPSPAAAETLPAAVALPAPAPPPAAVPEPPRDAVSERRWYRRPSSYVVLGGGMVLGVGGFFGVSAWTERQSGEQAPSYGEARPHFEESASARRVATAGAVAGLAVVVAGVIWRALE